ncbi:MAG: phosphotransferase [Anaerolineae bacterium]|nr:phosphotransferase [Anaerolineae bacterium]
MYQHPYFDLRLHGDDELASLMGSKVSERVTLHEWPLSCVQRLVLADGRRLIYKAQFGPTVESAFYANAKSELLPWAETIYERDGHVCMLIEFVEGPLAEELGLGAEEVIRIGREVTAQIATIEGELPHCLDITDGTKWETLAGSLVQDLRALIDTGAFTLTDEAVVHVLAQWASSEPVLAALRARPGYVHHDLGGDNLFVLPDGYRVIDWQRPILGPTDLDVATLLRRLGVDPLPHVGEGVVRMVDLLKVYWFTQSAIKWFPAGIADYDAQIADIVRGG